MFKTLHVCVGYRKTVSYNQTPIFSFLMEEKMIQGPKWPPRHRQQWEYSEFAVSSYNKSLATCFSWPLALKSINRRSFHWRTATLKSKHTEHRSKYMDIDFCFSKEYGDTGRHLTQCKHEILIRTPIQFSLECEV